MSRQRVTAWRPRASVDDRHSFAMARMAPDRRFDPAGGRVEAAPDEREILALERTCASVVGEELGEATVGRVGLGDDEQAGRVLVEPVDDARPPHPSDARQAGSAMIG